MNMTTTVTLRAESDKCVATASLTLENALVIYDIKVVQGQNGLFVAMPSRRERGGERWVDVVRLLNTEARAEVEALILGEYHKKKEAAGQQPARH